MVNNEILSEDEKIKHSVRELINELNDRLGKDQVTGLPDRSSSILQIKGSFEPERPSVVMLFSLTNLQQVNKRFGRGDGNMLFYQFAHILKNALSEKCFVGRYTGTEIIAVSQEQDVQAEDLLDIVKDKIDRYNRDSADYNIEYVCAFDTFKGGEYKDFDYYYESVSSELWVSMKSLEEKAASSQYNTLMGSGIDQRRTGSAAPEKDPETELLTKDAGITRISGILSTTPVRYHVLFDVSITENDDPSIAKLGAIVISRLFRQDDVLIKLEGNEYLAFITNVPGPALIESKALSIIEKTEEMLKERGLTADVNIGIGWSAKPVSAEAMLTQTNTALIEAECSNSNQFEITRVNDPVNE